MVSRKALFSSLSSITTLWGTISWGKAKLAIEGGGGNINEPKRGGGESNDALRGGGGGRLSPKGGGGGGGKIPGAAKL